jgi:hypothetical protein
MRKTFLKRCLLSLLSIPLSCAISHAAVFSTDFNSGAPAGVTFSAIGGSAQPAVTPSGGVGNSGVLQLTSNANGQGGYAYINDFTGGVLVTNLHVAYRLALGGGTCCGARWADGMSFSYTPTTPGPASYTAEEGTPTGLVVSFDTWDNAADDTAPAIEVRYNGAVVAFKSMYPGAGNNLRDSGRAPAGPVLQDSAGNPVSLFTLGTTRNDGSFVNVIIDLFPDNTVSVSYSNVVVFNHLAIPGYTPVSGGTYAFAGRTGGANEWHLIDNLYIAANDRPNPVTEISGPADVTTTETSPATFRVAADGTWPLTIQWYKNGVAISGATDFSYTIPSTTVAMNGDTFRADVSNAQNPAPVSSRTATLNVQPGIIAQSVSDRTTANKVYVTYNKPPALVGTYTIPGLTINSKTIDPANPNVVVLDTSAQTYDTTYTLTIADEKGTDSTALVPNPTTTKFHFGFGAFCQDFNNNQVPAGSALGGVATIQNGVVHLDEATLFSICGEYFIGDRLDGTPLDRLQARWRTYLGDGGGGGADGISFNWGPDVHLPSDCPALEEGVGSGLSVTADTYDNGGGETGIEIRWKGQRIAFQFMNKDNAGDGIYLRKSQFVDASVEVLPDGNVTFNYDGVVITAQLPDFQPVSGWNFMFGARTGGASDNEYIDDVKINCFTLAPPNFTQQPANTTVVEGDNATFTVGVEGAPPLTIQWYTNGVPVPGASGTSLTLPGNVDLSGTQVYVKAHNIFGDNQSSTATLTVTPAPRLVKASMGCEDNIIRVLWTKPVRGDGTYFTDVAIVNGVTVNPANPNEVIIAMDSVPIGTAVTLTVQDEHDTGGFVQYPETFDVHLKYGTASFCTDFENGLPAGTSINGVAHIADGIMHLTDDGQNGVGGAFFIPDQDAGANVTELHMTWKALIGGVDQDGEAQQFNTGGADGISLSWGSDVNSGTGGGPDGAGNGLLVTVDTFDNGGGEAPGIEIRYKGQRVAFSPITPGDQVAAKAYLRKGTFVDAQVDVFNSGYAQFTFDGITAAGVIPGWAGQAGANYVFGASTGGAQDNQWIDNVCINQGMFPDTTGPALKLPDHLMIVECGSGPVTYDVSALDHCSGQAAVTCNPPSGSNFPMGTSTVTCRSSDAAGNTSTGSFTVTVVDTTPPAITCPGDTSAEATGPNGAAVTFSTISSDNCGSATVVCTPASGSTFAIGTTAVACVATDGVGNTNSCSFNVLVKDSTGPVVSCPGNITVPGTSANGAVVNYAASATDAVDGSVAVTCSPASGSTFALGATTVTCTAQDAAGNTGSCSFTVTVLNPNQPPVCVARFGCTYQLGNDPTDYAIALNGSSACIVLNGSGSSDPDHNALSMKWIIDGTNTVSGAVVTNCLSAGCHSVVLVVSDGQAESRCVSRICVLSGSEAIDQIIAMVDGSDVARKNLRPLIATLKAAGASCDRGNFAPAIGQLGAFQNKVHAQIGKTDPAAANAMIAAVQKILDAIHCSGQ